MKKKLISTLLASAMLLSFSVTAMADATISFKDQNGNEITSLPDIGKVEASADAAGKVLIAEYNKDGRLLRVEENSMDAINDFDENTYVKAFAWDGLENIKPLTDYAEIVKDPDKKLLVSYANGFVENSGKALEKEITYGSAQYSAKRNSKFDAPIPLEDGLKVEDYAIIKVRYYVEDTELDRFWLCLMSGNEYGKFNRLENRYLYSPVAAENKGWNVATIVIDNMSQNNRTNDPDTVEDDSVRLPLSEAKYLGIMTHESDKIFGVKKTEPYAQSLYIDSVWLEKAPKLDDPTVIDFNSDKTWNALGEMPQFSKSKEQAYDGKAQSAKFTEKTDNWKGFIDLASAGFTTDWSGYKTINIRYYTDNTDYVPPVYLSTFKGWVMSGGNVGSSGSYPGSDGGQGAYKLKKGKYAERKASENGWHTVSYVLETDFDTYGKAEKIAWSNIPYMLIPTHQQTQYWNETQGSIKDLDPVESKVYIDSIWLGGMPQLDDPTVIDFSSNNTWQVLGTMPQFSKSTDFGYNGKTQSAKLDKTIANDKGYIDLASAGFITDWSDYKTINIRYYTDNTDYVQPIYFSTEQNWVGSTSETSGAFKINSGVYKDKAKGKERGWNVVSYNISQDKNDFTISGKGGIGWDNIPYMLIPNTAFPNNRWDYWNKDSAFKTGDDFNEVNDAFDTTKTTVYIDRIWLEK